MKKNIEINSSNLLPLEELKENFNKSIKNLKEPSVNNPLLKNMDNYLVNPIFKIRTLKKGELLFNEGDIDNNLYIVKKGHLSVEKYTTIEKNNSKQLAILKKGDFLGEAALKNSDPKRVLIKSLDESSIISIDAQKGINKYIKESPAEGFELLTHIIDVTNNRLMDANRLITANHEINRTINNVSEINQKTIFYLIDKMNSIIGSEYILFFEKNQVLEDYLTLKYDSRIKGKIQDIIYEKKGYFIDLDELYVQSNIDKKDFILINKVSIGKQILGFLIIGKQKNRFSSNEKKLITGIGNSLGGIIKQHIHQKEEKNKININEINY